MERREIHMLNEAHWQAYFRFFRRITTRYMPRQWCADWQHFRKRRLENRTLRQATEYVFSRENLPVAWLSANPNAARLNWDWGVDADQLDEALIHILIKTLGELLKGRDREQAFIESYIPQTEQLIQRLRGRCINRRLCYEFRREALRRLPDFPALEPTGYDIQLYRDRPDEMLEEYVALYDLVVLDIPRSDPEGESYRSWRPDALRRLNESHQQTGNTVYTGVVRNPAGQMVALTDVNIHLPHPIRLYQGMTGVHPDYRGQQLARWLKLQMLDWLARDFPNFEVIDADCHVDNLPMQKLNEALGYIRTGEGGEFEFFV